jgi:hypothetical protein
MRYKIYYIRYIHINTMEGLRGISDLEELKTVDADQLDAELTELYGKYVQLWIKPIPEEGD